MVKTKFCSFASQFLTSSNDRTKRTILPPVQEQRLGNMAGFVVSNEHVRSRRISAIRQQCLCRRSCIVIQASEYLLNDHRVFNTGNDADICPTFATGFSKSPHTAGGAALSRSKQGCHTWRGAQAIKALPTLVCLHPSKRVARTVSAWSR